MVQNGTYLIHYGVKGMKWGEHRMSQQYMPLSRAELFRRQHNRAGTTVVRPGTATSTTSVRPRTRPVTVSSGGTGVKKRTPISTGGKPVGSASVAGRGQIVVKKSSSSGGGTKTADQKKPTSSYDTKEAKEARRQAAIDRVSNAQGTAEKKSGSGKKGSASKKGSSKKETGSKGSSSRSSQSSSRKSSGKVSSSKKTSSEKDQNQQEANTTDRNPFEELKKQANESIDSMLENTKVNDENIDVFANKVIRGDYGNGAERKAALGENYHKIQARVNEILKEMTSKKKENKKTVSNEKPEKTERPNIKKQSTQAASMKAERKARRRREEIA